MRSRLKRLQEARARRRQERLLAAMEPVREAVLRLAQEQQRLRELMEQLVLRPERPTLSPVQAEMQHRETQALLLDLLDSLQPKAEEQLTGLLSGRPTPPPTPRASDS